MSTQSETNKQERAAKIIQNAMSFPIEDVLKKYCKVQSLPMEVAREHEREIKRFLALHAINPNTMYGMKGPMDELWHAFVLFTKKYTEFCYHVAGHYMHHFPSVPGEKPVDNKHYKRFLEDYQIVFGEEPPPQFWPRPKKFKKDGVQCGCGCDCSGGGCEGNTGACWDGGGCGASTCTCNPGCDCSCLA